MPYAQLDQHDIAWVAFMARPTYAAYMQPTCHHQYARVRVIQWEELTAVPSEASGLPTLIAGFSHKKRGTHRPSTRSIDGVKLALSIAQQEERRAEQRK